MNTNMSGWRIGREISVVVSKRTRRGVLVSRTGAKWCFRPHGYKKTVPVCPVRSKWRYVFNESVKPWPKKLSVILIKSTGEAFRFKKEKFGAWHGAATVRTKICKLPVWQVRGTNKLYVGHLGVWRLAISSGSKLKALCQMPRDRHFYIGRGALTPKRFKCLKTVCRLDAPRSNLKTSIQLYKIPTRDELN